MNPREGGKSQWLPWRRQSFRIGRILTFREGHRHSRRKEQ